MKFDVEKEYKYCSGIYVIKNNINGKFYIGKSIKLYGRYWQQLDGMRKKDSKKCNPKLIQDVDFYGLDCFTFSIHELVDKVNLKERESYWIEFYQNEKPDNIYNLRNDIDGKMFCHPDTKIKISNRLTEEWSNGVRDGHSEKLKNSWKDRDRSFQSSVMTKALTKYEYHVYEKDNISICSYSELVDKGYKNALGKFYDADSNDVIFKGVRIKRERV